MPASFSVIVNGDPTPVLQWQRQQVGTDSWVDLHDTEIFSGSGTSRLAVAMATVGMNGEKFRCVASNFSGSVVSDTAILAVGPATVTTGVDYGVLPYVNSTNVVGKKSMVIQSGSPTLPKTKVDQPASSRVIVKLRNQQAQSLAQAFSPATRTVNLASVASVDRNLGALLSKHAVKRAAPLFTGAVRAKRQQGRSDAQLRNSMRQRFPKRAARAPLAIVSPDLSSTYVFDLGSRSAAEVTEAVRSLRTDTNVLYAEEDRVVRTQYIPNDPSYSSSGTWGQAYDDLYGLKKIGTTLAWNVTHGHGVLVAVVDTGIDYNHPDIKDNIWINPGEIPGNGIDDDNNGFTDDVRGWDFVGQSLSTGLEDNDPFDGHFHGTHVAGTIAATGNNSLGVVGVAWEAKVMAVKGLDDGGSGYDSDLASAIVYAVDNGADVINASWGGEGFSQTETDAIEYAHANGVVFVAAAGNSTLDASNFTPASVSHAIAVSSLDPYDNLSYFSNFGSKVELAAPGEDILSLEAGTAGYSRKSGTSMAAPHVSGVAALIIAQHPTYSNEQVRQALRASATDLGAAGKDSSFGYGRVNAAQGVRVDQALAAKILSPADGLIVSAPTPLAGSAGGSGFDHYLVDYGAGTSPVTWTTLRSSTTSVADGDLGTLDTSRLADGIYTVRLRAFHTGGEIFSDQIQIKVRYLEFASPVPPPVPSLTQVVKPGVPLPISGWAVGPSFQHYVLEWAPGSAATSGWSSTGFILAGGGLSSVANGPLGTWTPPETLKGYHTVRLTVTNDGFSSATTTVVYAEPSLISGGWPKFAQNVWYEHNVQPVRQHDGTTRFVLCGVWGDPWLYSFALDGSEEKVELSNNGSYFQPCIANLDGQPGDEIVVSDGYELKIFSSNLTLVKSISPGAPMMFGYEQVCLADLDNDGVPEIIAPARDSSPPYGVDGVLYVYRTDGTIFSKNYPLTFPSVGVQENGDKTMLVAVDLNGDGCKEIVVAVKQADPISYSLQAFNADGTPYAGWTAPPILPKHYLMSLATADLDHDGTSELVITEGNWETSNQQIRVVNSTGVVRAGWPVVLGPGSVAKIAIGDLDRDQRNEIVVANSTTLSFLRDDGTAWCPPFANGGVLGYGWPTAPLIADIDGDGVPEIISAVSNPSFSDGPIPYHYATLTSYRLDGSIQQSWPVFGAEGRQPFLVTPLVGDFNGDGATDLALNIALIEGGGLNGNLFSTAVTCLTTGTAFNAVGSDWTSRLHDPQNSRNASRAAPVITSQPTQQTVFTGSTVTLSAAACGAPIPAFQWQKNGINLPGATNAKLTLPAVLLSDSGNYTVVATNAIGSVTSLTAKLTVNKGSAIITWPTPAPILYGTALSGTQLNATGGVAGTFVYSPTSGSVLNAGRHTLTVSFTPADLVNYFGTSAQQSIVVNLASGAPLFLVQPTSQSVPIGTSVIFASEASGVTAPTYQWQKNGVNISGATGSTYAIANATAASAGSYRVIATNLAGNATSNAAVLHTFVAAPSDVIITISVE